MLEIFIINALSDNYVYLLRNDKEKLFYTLWKKRDRTPDTEFNELMDEYYKRVAYANENLKNVDA